MRYKIVADSACNVLSGSAGDYTTVPMKIVAEKEYVDDHKFCNVYKLL